jgi:rod shape-determining protein MreD
MNWFTTLSILLCGFLAVFWQALFPGIRHLLGAQVDLLPALMVYTSLQAGIGTIAALAVIGGLCFDSLSANPLGLSLLPLFVVGLVTFAYRDLILRDQLFAQLILGFAASAITPIITLLLLLTTGRTPLLGWSTVWQILVMAVGGAVATPLFFELFRVLQRFLGYQQPTQSSFRPDREIRRGR